MTYQRTLGLAFLLLLAALGIAGQVFAHMMNADGVAYLSLADQYSHGHFDRAVSGYWGPLLSWLGALLLASLPATPAGSALAIGRLLMAGSAILFFWGCVWFFREARLPENGRKAGAWTAALVSVPWSVGQLSPDLLQAALLAFAMGFLLRAQRGRWTLNTSAAGLLWGLACLAKPVALPLMALVGAGWHCWIWRKRTGPALSAGIAFWMAGMVVIMPWVAVLTQHYGTLTFSTSARIAHAIAGPLDQERYHPTMRTIHEGGFMTTWEDPSQMTYADWSPLENPAYALHQVKVCARNLGLTQAMLTSVFAGWPIVLGGAALIGWRRWRKPAVASPCPATDQLRSAIVLSAITVAALVLVYLPNYLAFGDQRYFYAAFPGLFLLGAWSAQYLRPGLAEKWRQGLVLTLFFAPSLALIFWILPPKRQAGELAHELAERMGRYELTKGVFGPIGGSAMQPGGRVGLYTAFLLRQPWVGDDPNATAEVWRQTDLAEFILVNRGESLAAQLAAHPDYHDLTPELFPSPGEVARFPIQVFKFTRHPPP